MHYMQHDLHLSTACKKTYKGAEAILLVEKMICITMIPRKAG